MNLKNSEEFRKFFSSLITSVPFDGLFFETKPMHVNQLDEKLEFVLVNSPSVARIQADKQPFKKHFTNDIVVAFPNLGKDATLVVPCPMANTNEKIFGHLVIFLRKASEQQKDDFWRITGEKLEERLSKGKNIWLSTSGLGVYWLHIRICDSPKYYSYSKFK